ncbi:MAG: enoyl-CoA hydratase-related protein [Alphaproteobacteria bacterium]|nr:enoyl-CoA hydratase-related protein [Alphaproteobacteria bacterium]
MASNDEVLVTRRGQALILTFNRPDHANAMTMDMASQLHLHLKNATTDRSVRAVLLRGAGGNYMDGLDMGFYKKNFSDALEKANQIIQPYHMAIRELQVMDKPVISLAEGYVSGTGLSFLLASDFVLSARSAIFCSRVMEYGLTPDGGCSFFLTRKIGMSRALEILMLSEEIPADRAKSLRLINRIIEDDKVEEEAMAWLDRFANGPTKAYGAIKKMVNKAFDQDLNAQLGLEHSYFGQSSRSFDFREAVRAAVENRDPKFSGT